VQRHYTLKEHNYKTGDYQLKVEMILRGFYENTPAAICFGNQLISNFPMSALASCEEETRYQYRRFSE
jgi:hypothetical protein